MELLTYGSQWTGRARMGGTASFPASAVCWPVGCPKLRSFFSRKSPVEFWVARDVALWSATALSLFFMSSAYVVEVKSSSSEESLNLVADVYEMTPAAKRLQAGRKRRRRRRRSVTTVDEGVLEEKVASPSKKASMSSRRSGNGGVERPARPYNRYAANCRGMGSPDRLKTSLKNSEKDKVLGRQYRVVGEEWQNSHEAGPSGADHCKRARRSSGAGRDGGKASKAVTTPYGVRKELPYQPLPLPLPPPQTEQWPGSSALTPLKIKPVGDRQYADDGRSSVSTAATTESSCGTRAIVIPWQPQRAQPLKAEGGTVRRFDDAVVANEAGGGRAAPEKKRKKKRRGKPKPKEGNNGIDSDWEWNDAQVGHTDEGMPDEAEQTCPVRGCHETVLTLDLDSHILARHQGSSHAADIRRRYESERAFRERKEKPAEERPRIAGVRCPTPLVGILLAHGSTSLVSANYRPHPEIEKALAEVGPEQRQQAQQDWTLARICARLVCSCRIERIGKMRERSLVDLLGRVYQPVVSNLPKSKRNGKLGPIREAMCKTYRRQTLSVDQRATVLLLWRYSEKLT